MKVKRVISMLLVLCVVLTWLPSTASAEESVVASGSCGDNLTWTLDSAGTLTISGIGEMTDAPWTDMKSEIKTVVVEAGVTSIGSYAFFNCSNLTSAAISDSVTTIGQSAFEGCSSLASFTVPSSVTCIMGNAFTNCDTLTTITIMNLSCEIDSAQSNPGEKCYTLGVPGTTTIHGYQLSTAKAYAEENGFNFSTHDYENGVCSFCGAQEIAYAGSCGKNLTWCLTGDTGVLTISGSGSMTEFKGAGYVPWYSYHDYIKEIHIGNEVTTIGGYAFYDCANVRNITIPNSIVAISCYAFSRCESLNAVTIPDSVSQIAWEAFSQCKNLTSITVCGSNCDISSDRGTLGVPGTTVVHGYEKSSASYVAKKNGYTFTAHAYENGVCTICGVSRVLSGVVNETIEWSLDTATGELSASGTGNLSSIPWKPYSNLITNVDIGDGIIGIPNAAFFYCDELVSIRFGTGLTAIPDSCFFGCGKLESVELPNSVKEIGKSAFHQCYSLTSINLPADLETIDSGAFDFCTGLTSVCFPDSLESIYSGAFAGCTSLSKITFGKLDAPYISSDAFADVIATVYYPEANATWSDRKEQDYGGTLTWQAYEVDAVEGICGDNITWIFDDGVLTITGTGCMYDYWTENGSIVPWHEYLGQIVTINMSDDITNIGAGAFYGCYNLETAKLSNDIAVIGEFAFSHAGISNLVIPEGAVEIGRYAFSSTALDSITFPSTLKSVGKGAFEWAGVENVYVPSLEAWCGIKFDAFFANPFEETVSNHLYVDGELVTDVVIPYGVTQIGVSQFAGYSSLTSIQIPDSVTRVDKQAFDMTPNGYGSDSKLTEIVFPASVEYIGERALGFNENLQKIVILNPCCEIACPTVDDQGYYHDGIYVAYSENAPVIYGYSGSTAEAYASAEGLEFVALENYKIINGANSTVKTGEDLTIRADGDFSKFESVAVDGLMIDPANYTVSEGSTIVTFTAEYLSTLEPREHSVTVFFTDGVASTTLTILAYVPGDINSDGTVNNKDVTRLFQYLSDWDVNVNEAALDVNADGAVNNKDLTRLFQYLSDWDVEIH